jgi:hypothetical protein
LHSQNTAARQTVVRPVPSSVTPQIQKENHSG